MSIHTDKSPIYIDQYDYRLPTDRIAKYPLRKRDESNLLVYKNAAITKERFYNIDRFLPQGSLLVYNNTRVIHARIVFHKSTGARIEVFCLEPIVPNDYSLSLAATDGCEWKCMVGNLKKWKNEKLRKNVVLNRGWEVAFCAELCKPKDGNLVVRFSWDAEDVTFSELLLAGGELPIPPYLNRKTETSDHTAYQTVYSKIEGSVAAPTAGLHFTKDVLKRIKQKNINTEELTLHVGAGTFQPIKCNDVSDHTMHAEMIAVKIDTLKMIEKSIGNIIAVGTTSVRTLETLYWIGANHISENSPLDATNNTVFHVSQWEPYKKTSAISATLAISKIIRYLEMNKLEMLFAETQIMIKPGYRFRLVKGMITNFHQPKSTLLLLISAFVGDHWKDIYQYALANDFRFLSYGDSSLLFNE